MCGITGWVDFGRDLRTERAAIEAMTATMACRGPDAGNVWCSPHAAIGHRGSPSSTCRAGISRCARPVRTTSS